MMGVTREENLKRIYSDLPSLNRTKRVRFQNNGTMLLCLLYSEEKKQLFRNYSFKIIRIRILELLLKIGQNFSFSKTNFCLLLPISRPHKL